LGTGRYFRRTLGFALSHKVSVNIAAFAQVTILSSIVFLTLKKTLNLASNLMELLNPDECIDVHVR
jgi:hypothetical protein